MKDHHVNFKQPEYYRTTMFDGKISVLLQQQQPLATSAATTTTTADAENTEETGQNSSTEDPAAAAAAATSSSSSLDETTTGGNTATMAGGDPPRTSVLMELTDRVGVLHDVLKYFWKYDVNICRIESRPTKTSSGSTTTKKKKFDFFVDIEGSVTENPNVQKLLDQLRLITDKILILDETKCVHWFPRHVSELDYIANRTLDAGTDLLAPDHPGFHDPIYRQRRAQLAHLASEHRYDRPIPHVSYTPEEISAWTAVWDRIQPLTHQYACQAYLTAFEQLQRHCGYARENIPQVADVSEYLTLRTGFRIRPVAGLLSSRDFLNGLAFRVFFSTQYIRHSASPLYTPEPDVCHELLGHAPMLANRDFADFSQEIGLASLGASDEDVDKLAHVRTTPTNGNTFA
jgi:phenylalanine-4-hydroxylase